VTAQRHPERNGYVVRLDHYDLPKNQGRNQGRSQTKALCHGRKAGLLGIAKGWGQDFYSMSNLAQDFMIIEKILSNFLVKLKM
jgi:hypothetical protein